jgi:hypothetical protein
MKMLVLVSDRLCFNLFYITTACEVANNVHLGSQCLLEQFEFQLEMLYVKFQHFPEMCLWFLYECASKSKMQALTSNVRDIFTSFPKFLNVKSTNLPDMFLYIHTHTYSLFP